MPSSFLPLSPAAPPWRLQLAGMGWAALSVLIFAGWFVVTRFTVTHQLRVWDVLALRFGIGAVLLLPVLAGRGRALPAGAWREGLLYALLWGAPFVLLVAFGLRLTSAAQASSLTPALMPVCAGALGWLLLGDRPARAARLGYLAILAGLAVLIAADAHALGRASGPGIAVLALAAAMWAGYTLRFRRSGLTALQSAALICLWSAVLFLPAYVLLGLSRLDRATWQELAFQALYQGALMSAVAIVAYNRAIAALGARAAAAIIALVPVTATLLAVAVLHEAPSSLGGVAILAIAAGVVLAARPAPAPAPVTAAPSANPARSAFPGKADSP